MNILPRIIRRVKLNDPIHRGNIQSSRRHIRTQQYPSLGIDKFEKGVGPFLLFLTAVEVQDGDVDVVEEFCVVFYGVAGGEEDDYFLFEVLFEEGEEEEEAGFGRADDVALFYFCDLISTLFCFFVIWKAKSFESLTCSRPSAVAISLCSSTLM